MARGWESKSVENQVAEFESKKARENSTELTPQQAENSRQRGSLLLARTRVQNDLNAATNPNRCGQLRQALDHLDAQLSELDASRKT
jgi:hypothetical protein